MSAGMQTVVAAALARALPALRAAAATATHRGAHQAPLARAAASAAAADAAAAAAPLKRTVLHEYHLANGAKMVPFAGYEMPIQYKDSIVDSSTFCRTNASVFDVSHMCGVTLTGADVLDYMHRIVVGDIKALKPGTGSLSVMLNARGGIIDDTVVTKVSDTEVYMVVNAGCRCARAAALLSPIAEKKTRRRRLLGR